MNTFCCHLQTNKKRWEELEKKLHPKNDVSSSLKDKTTPPPLPQVQRAHRCVSVCMCVCVLLCVLNSYVYEAVCVSDRMWTEYDSDLVLLSTGSQKKAEPQTVMPLRSGFSFDTCVL